MTKLTTPGKAVREAKSRTTTPATSVYDFQLFDKIVINSGDSNPVRKIVKEIDPVNNTLTVTDGDGGAVETIHLDPDNLPRVGDAFKYYIDESERNASMPAKTHKVTEESDDYVGDDDDLGFGDAVDLGSDYDGVSDGDGDFPDDVADDLEDMVDLEPMGDDSDDWLESILGTPVGGLQEEDSVGGSPTGPDVTAGGAVDSSTHDDEDGEATDGGVTGDPVPTDSNTGTLAKDEASNGDGSKRTDAVATHGAGEGTESGNGGRRPDDGIHEPEIDKEINEAIAQVRKGTNPDKLAPNLLRGKDA